VLRQSRAAAAAVGPAALVVESYTPLENQPMHGQFSGRTQPTWLVLRNQP
jgi:hypothetical protein